MFDIEVGDPAGFSQKAHKVMAELFEQYGSRL